MRIWFIIQIKLQYFLPIIHFFSVDNDYGMSKAYFWIELESIFLILIPSNALNLIIYDIKNNINKNNSNISKILTIIEVIDIRITGIHTILDHDSMFLKNTKNWTKNCSLF
jgi:hypothetical protein